MILLSKINQRDIDPKYIFLRQIRSNPRKVQIHHLKTDEVATYPSIYRAAWVLGQNPGVIGMYNGKVWRNRYAIKVLTESDLILIRFLKRIRIVIFLINHRHLLPSDWNDNILSEITSANALVFAGTFSMKFAFI